MSRRRPSRVKTAVVDLSLDGPQESASYAAVLRGLIQHILFFRGQIPSLYEQLLQLHARDCAAAPGRRSRPSRSRRRVQQLVAVTEELLGSVQAELFAARGPTRCLVLLGTSAARPREAYEVCFPAPSELGGDGRDAGQLCRLVLRQLVVATPDIPEGTADRSE